MIYFDTSALIKRFVTEKGTSWVRSTVVRDAPIATAKIAYAEIFAGLARKLRERQISQSLHALACRQFERDWRSYIQVELRDEVLYQARDLIQRHPLRGFDAVHLASALMLRNELDEQVTFAAADRRLLQAAGTENLVAINVEDSQVA